MSTCSRQVAQPVPCCPGVPRSQFVCIYAAFKEGGKSDFRLIVTAHSNAHLNWKGCVAKLVKKKSTPS